MIRDITIGQYYPSNSIIHRLDPRVKLMGTLTYVLSLFLFRGLAGFAAVTAGLAAVVKLSKVPFRYMVKGLKAIAAILAITVMFNLFLTPGEPLVSVWKLKITEEGLKSAGFMAKAVLPDTGQLRAHTGYYAQPTDGRHGEIPAPLPQDRGPSP